MAFLNYLAYHRLYSLENVKRINKKLKPFLEPSADSTTKGPAQSRKDCQVSVAEWGKTKSFLQGFIDQALYMNEQNFGVHIYPVRNNYYLIHNYYKAGQQYDFHVDESPWPPSSCKLTCLLNLSTSPYSGGEFMIRQGSEEKVVREFNTPGVMVVFPSYILHRVTPIIQGTRISLAALLEGPKWV